MVVRGSKEALFSAVLERRDAEDFVEMLDFDGDVWAYLDKWVALVNHNAEVPGMVKLYTAMAIGGADPGHPAHSWLHQHFERAIDETARLFEDGKRIGVVAPDAPSLELSRAIAALSDGIQIQWLCAQGDAVAARSDGGQVGSDGGSGGSGDVVTRPMHGGASLDMGAQMALLVDLIKVRWRVSPDGDQPVS